jgi:tungstate transport system substrate-binding protein
MRGLRAIVLIGSVGLLGVVGGLPVGASTPAGKVLTLATTTSTQDTGLLDVLIPPFEKVSGVKVKVIAVGTGQALELGRRGDADVLLVHAPEMEEQFVKEGHGLARRPIMYNDFVLVGPKSDLAAVRGKRSVVEAFQAIAQGEAPFVSRGDKSGTHVKELALWKAAKVEPKGDWYLEGGSGMAATLRLADERAAYTLSDRFTYLVWKDKLALQVLVEGDPVLRNVYSVIVVNPEKHPGVQSDLAARFADYLFSKQAAKIIGEFGKEKFGRPLFTLLPQPKPATRPR